jgi:hypothetical protein
VTLLHTSPLLIDRLCLLRIILTSHSEFYFTDNIAHNLRTPIQSINMGIELLKSEYSSIIGNMSTLYHTHSTLYRSALCHILEIPLIAWYYSKHEPRTAKVSPRSLKSFSTAGIIHCTECLSYFIIRSRVRTFFVHVQYFVHVLYFVHIQSLISTHRATPLRGQIILHLHSFLSQNIQSIAPISLLFF